MDPATAPVLVTTLIACAFDLRTRRIPNALTFGAALLAIVVNTWTGGTAALAVTLAGWATGAALFFPFFLLRGMGGGDVKLLAAFGAWLGPGATVHVATYAAVTGGILAIVIATSRGYLRTALTNVWVLVTTWMVVGLRPVATVTLERAAGPRLAYAIPLTFGVLGTLWLE